MTGTNYINKFEILNIYGSSRVLRHVMVLKLGVYTILMVKNVSKYIKTFARTKLNVSHQEINFLEFS